eukprot:354734-Chlamydomonas_euryale.AAC.13
MAGGGQEGWSGWDGGFRKPPSSVLNVDAFLWTVEDEFEGWGWGWGRLGKVKRLKKSYMT